MDPRERLIAAMPSVDEIHERRIAPWELEGTVLQTRRRDGTEGLAASLGCELASSGDDTCYYGHDAGAYEHSWFSWFVRVWAIEPPARRTLPSPEAELSFEQPFYEGICDTGSVWISMYVEGADLGELQRTPRRALRSRHCTRTGSCTARCRRRGSGSRSPRSRTAAATTSRRSASAARSAPPATQQPRDASSASWPPWCAPSPAIPIRRSMLCCAIGPRMRSWC
jgi:hypothetical protein